MPPKKASTAGTKKAAASSTHASYQDMIVDAILKLKDRSGSSRQALKKYVQANNNLSGVTDAQFTTQFNRALQKGSDTGVFDRPKGTSGPVKLAGPKKAAAPAAAKTTIAKAPAKKTAATKVKTTATKKAPTKAAAKKTTAAKKAPAKKSTATKAKSTTTKARKTPAAAPAVEDKPPVVLGKTKSGRVTKSAAPQVTKKAATKRKAPAKKATPKKAATPKSKA